MNLPPFDLATLVPDDDPDAELLRDKAQQYPWKTLHVTRLSRKEEFTRGSGWGKNAWGDRYRGPATINLYVPIRESLNHDYNLLIAYDPPPDRGLPATMILLQDTTPAFRKPRSLSSPEIFGYYEWMGSGTRGGQSIGFEPLRGPRRLKYEANEPGEPKPVKYICQCRIGPKHIRWCRFDEVPPAHCPANTPMRRVDDSGVEAGS